MRSGAMFTGTVERQLDDKSRLALPAHFRQLLGDSGYLVFGQDRCIDVIPAADFRNEATRLLDGVRAGDIPMARQRAFAHSATAFQLDKQGRVTLDEKLRTYAALQPGSRVVVSGNIDRIEVWSTDVYERVSADGQGEMAGGRS